MRRSVQTLLGLVVLSGAFLASSVWSPTAEAATWDCQDFEPPLSGSDGTTINIAVTNLSSDDIDGTVRLRNDDGDTIDSPGFDFNPGEGATFTFDTQNAYRASITADTDKARVTAVVYHYEGSALVAARDAPCVKR